MAKKNIKKSESMEQQQRLKGWLRFGVRFIALISLLGVVLWGGVKLSHPDTLPIRSIQIQGQLHYLDKQQLQSRLAGSVIGNFFTVGIHKIKASVKDLPWVAEVTVRRVWPDTVRVDVREYEPYARWADGGFLDRDGAWFDAPHEAVTKYLPMLKGPRGYESIVNQKLKSLGTVLQLLDMEIDQIQVNQRRAWRLVTTQGIVFNLGKEDLEQKLKRFVRVYPLDENNPGRKLKQIDLRYSNGVAVQWDLHSNAAKEGLVGG